MKHLRLCIVSFLFTGSLIAGDVPTLKDYLGRWNIKILNSGDSFKSSWLKIEQTGGKTRGELVWKWGSVGSINKITVKDGVLSFSRGGTEFTAELSGSKLEGHLGGGKIKFMGRRAKEMCDVTGTWIVVPVNKPDARPGELIFSMKKGKITGKAVDPEGDTFPIQDAELKGYVLTCKCRMDENIIPDIRCEIRGDRLSGTVSVKDSEGKLRSIKLKGERKRKWGKPVKLLKENSIDGWKRRSKRKFTWQVKDGVLENMNPPCDDIVSKRKFRDFKLHLEYKVGNKDGHVANSGIYLRGRYELQILGDPSVKKHGNMAVYSRLSPKINPMSTPLETSWQLLDVIFIGRWVTVILNGQVVHNNAYLDGITGGALDPWEEKPGPFLLQGDHGKVYFRNIVVTPAR